MNAVRQALLENTLCLIGFSGDDPNFLKWVGWIHDSLGEGNSPKMYLVGVLDLSPSERTALEHRNITPVDMSLCPDIGRNHYQALQQFLDYLQSRRADDNRLAWPGTPDHRSPSDCQATSGIDPPATPKTDPPKKRRMLLKWWVFR